MSLGRRGGLLVALCCSLALALAGCGDTLQDKPVGISSLERLMMVHRFPVYWLGTSFRGLAVASVSEDPSGAYTIQYGNCSIGGQYTCVTPLELVTNPDNSFLPGGAAPSHSLRIRGLPGTLTRGGDALELPTGEVVVDIYGQTPALTRAAGAQITPINRLAPLGAPLPSRAPADGFAQRPLPTQLPAVPDSQPGLSVR